MNRKLRRLRKDIERAGGRVVIPEDLPDDLARAFIEEITSCPDCAKALAESTPIPRGRGEH